MGFVGHDEGLIQCEDITRVTHALFGVNGHNGLCKILEDMREMVQNHEKKFNKLEGFSMVGAFFSIVTAILMFWKFIISA